MLYLRFIFNCCPEAKYFTRFFRTPLNNFLRCPEVDGVGNKMDNLRFIDEETIPLVQNEDMIIMVHQIQAG